MMKWDAGKFEREWKKLHGKRAKLDIGKSVHEMLENYKNRYFQDAWDAYLVEHPQIRDERARADERDQLTREGTMMLLLKRLKCSKKCNRSTNYGSVTTARRKN